MARTFLRRMLISCAFRRFLCLAVMSASAQALLAQSPQAPSAYATAAVPSDTWHSDQATLLAGLPDFKQNARGVLALSPAALTFSTAQNHASIDRAAMLSVAVGDERREMGGGAGRLTRAIVPFGGGTALAAVGNKQVSLLTIQFRDDHKALHGAVFLLPKNQALLAQQQLGSFDAHVQAEAAVPSCEQASPAQGNAMVIAPIATSGGAVPDEYKVLLYEELLLRLRQKDTSLTIYRDGDDAAPAACPDYHFLLTIAAFKKGNEALRASTGPVGLFVGTTSLTFHAVVQSRTGQNLLDKDFRVSQRGDTDSLSLPDQIAKSLAGKLKKARQHS